MRINARTAAKIAILLQFAALIRCLAEYFRLKWALGAAVTLARVQPFVVGALVAAIGAVIAVGFYFAESMWLRRLREPFRSQCCLRLGSRSSESLSGSQFGEAGFGGWRFFFLAGGNAPVLYPSSLRDMAAASTARPAKHNSTLEGSGVATMERLTGVSVNPAPLNTLYRYGGL